MELRTAVSPRDVKHYTTERLREEFLISNLFPADEIRLVYSHIDRIITGGIMPVQKTLVSLSLTEKNIPLHIKRECTLEWVQKILVFPVWMWKTLLNFI